MDSGCKPVEQGSAQTPTGAPTVDVDAINQGLFTRCCSKTQVMEHTTACEPAGSKVDIAGLQPAVRIKYGDSQRDIIETDDIEVLCIVVKNPHQRVTIKNFTVRRIHIKSAGGGAVPPLPDGTPSVDLTPSEMIGFGDLGPGVEIAREVVLVTKGAIAGDYHLTLDYSFAVEVARPASDEFKFKLVRS